MISAENEMHVMRLCMENLNELPFADGRTRNDNDNNLMLKGEFKCMHEKSITKADVENSLTNTT